MKKIIAHTLLFGGLAAGMLTAGIAVAGPMGHRGPVARLMAVADDIGLTQAQQDEIAGIVEGRKGEVQSLRSEMRTSLKALDQAITDGADNDTIAGLAIEVHTLRADGKELRRDIKKEVGSVLTAEQKAQLKQMRAERRGEGRGQGRRGGHKGRF